MYTVAQTARRNADNMTRRARRTGMAEQIKVVEQLITTIEANLARRTRPDDGTAYHPDILVGMARSLEIHRLTLGMLRAGD